MRSYEEAIKSKHPQYNPKTMHAVTERVLRSWCGVSNAYLFSVETCHNRALALGASRDDIRVRMGVVPGEHSGSYMIVAQDSLKYAMEMTLKAAQLLNGLHQLNKTQPGAQDNIEIDGLIYVHIRPTHRLDQIIDKCLSHAMKDALAREAPGAMELAKDIYTSLHGEQARQFWAPGEQHRKVSVQHDSLRYMGHWSGIQFAPQVIISAVDSFRRLNTTLPQWFNDPQLRSPGNDD